MSGIAAYGALYLDTNEDVVKLTAEQIESFKRSESPPHWVFFDIIARKGETAEALAARGYVQQELIHELGDGSFDLRFYVAIGFSEEDRPARKAMLTMVEEAEAES